MAHRMPPLEETCRVAVGPLGQPTRGDHRLPVFERVTHRFEHVAHSILISLEYPVELSGFGAG